MKPELFEKTQRLFKLGGQPAEPIAAPETDDPDAQRAKSRRRRLVLMSVLAFSGASAGIYALTHLNSTPPPHVTPAETAQAVTVVETASRQFHPRVTLNGEARPTRDIHVYSPSSGVRVLELLADEGDQVRAGQALARLDIALSDAQIAAARASVAEAESTAVRARDEYRRAESIRSSGALSDEAIGQRRAAAAAAEARLAAARAQYNEVNARLQGGYVRAPVAGKVISRSVQLGAMVDQQEMFRIAGGNALEVSAQVAESDVLALQVGETATFYLVDGTSETGSLRRAPASINSRTRTGEALFDLPAATRVRAGMFLRGEAQMSAHEALAAPQSSVLYDDGQPYVYVVDAQNRAHKTPVRIGQREGDMVEILSGVAPGARLVGSGAAFIQDTDLVRPIDTNPQPQPPQQHGENEAAPELRGRSA